MVAGMLIAGTCRIEQAFRGGALGCTTAHGHRWISLLSVSLSCVCLLRPCPPLTFYYMYFVRPGTLVAPPTIRSGSCPLPDLLCPRRRLAQHCMCCLAARVVGEASPDPRRAGRHRCKHFGACCSGARCGKHCYLDRCRSRRTPLRSAMQCGGCVDEVLKWQAIFHNPWRVRILVGSPPDRPHFNPEIAPRSAPNCTNIDTKLGRHWSNSGQLCRSEGQIFWPNSGQRASPLLTIAPRAAESPSARARYGHEWTKSGQVSSNLVAMVLQVTSMCCAGVAQRRCAVEAQASGCRGVASAGLAGH